MTKSTGIYKQRRTTRKLCACGCGEYFTPEVKPGRVPDYKNDTHKRRALRARQKAANGQSA